MKREWYYATNGTKSGPVTSGELRILANEGKLSSSDLVWKDGMSDWKPAGQVKGLIPAQTTSLGVITVASEEPRSIGAPPQIRRVVALACAGLLIVVFCVGLLAFLRGVPSKDSASEKVADAEEVNGKGMKAPSLTSDDRLDSPNELPPRVKYALQNGKTVWMLDFLDLTKCGEKPGKRCASFVVWDGETIEGIESRFTTEKGFIRQIRAED